MRKLRSELTLEDVEDALITEFENKKKMRSELEIDFRKTTYRCTHCFLSGRVDFMKFPRAFGAFLQKDMLDAIEFAKNVHMMSKQASLKRKMDYQREEYQKDIDRWFNAGQDSLGLTENDIPDQSDQSIQSEKSTFYDNLTSLGNQPYLKVLAVFLAAD